MEEKIKILGISKNEHRSEFLFPKEQKVFKIVIEFLSRLGFTDDDEWFYSFACKWDSEIHGTTGEKEDIKDYVDRIDNFSNKDYSADVIFFSKEVALILNYKQDKQKEIARALKGLIYEEGEEK